MRSILIHFQSENESLVGDWLDKAATRMEAQEWHLRSGGQTILSCRLSDDFSDWSPGELDSLRNAVPAPSLYLQADVSGRIPGDDEVKALWQGVLDIVPAARVQDDHTEHLWTREELDRGTLVQGHPFFDYKGWCDETAG